MGHSARGKTVVFRPPFDYFGGPLPLDPSMSKTRSLSMPTDLNTFDTTPHYAADADDGRTPLALIAGLVAALMGGGIWAALVFITNLEIGWVAWGVGGLVGI